MPPTPKLPIAIRKGTCFSRNPNPIYAFTINCDRLSQSYFSFVTSLDSVSIPKTTSEVVRLITLSSTSNTLLANAFTLLFLLMTLSSRVMMSQEFDNSKSTFHNNFILKIWTLSDIF